MDDKNIELQQRYMQMQMLHQQIEQTQKQLQLMEKQVGELETIKEGLGEIKKTEKDTEILVPISSGIFIKAAIKDTENVTVNVGSNVAAKKTIEEAQELLENQRKEIIAVKSQLTEDLNKMSVQASLIEEELKKIVGD